MRLADLHIHTHFSDGTQSPKEVVEESLEKKLACIAITDHDVLDGIQPTMDEAAGRELEVLPGIELSTEIDGKDVHILGYLFDYQSSPLARKMYEIQQVRIDRMKSMIHKLTEFGIRDIEFEEVAGRTQSRSVGRPHLAAALVEKGHVKNIKEAFDKYLAEGRPVHYAKFKQTPFEAIDLIKQSGGLAIMAHPMLTQKDECIKRFVQAGLDGIEVYYANCSDSVIHYYEKLARKYKLLMTGGSDSHGSAKSYTSIGKASISYDLVEQLKAAL